MTEPTCKSCGKPFSEHLGVQPLCEKYQNTARELRMAYEESGQIEIEMERLREENERLKKRIAQIEFDVGEIARSMPTFVSVREGGGPECPIKSLVLTVSNANDELKHGREMVDALMEFAEHVLPLRHLVDFVMKQGQIEIERDAKS